MTLAVVAGALANKPGNGGEAWVRMSWAEGLRRLGFDVQFVEQIDPAICVDDAGRPSPVERSANLAWFRAVTRQFGFGDSATLVCTETGRSWGLSDAELRAAARRAALLVNISGHLTLDAFLDRGQVRKAYVDLDPGFTQLWHAAGDLDGHLERHDAHFTVGTNVGRDGCSIPTSGFDWRPVFPPVLLDRWPYTPSEGLSRFTTVATWRNGYGPVVHGGIHYGLKVHEFRKVLALPRLARQRFQLALDIHPDDAADRRRLEAAGWEIVDPCSHASDPVAYRSYVQGSDAEFSVAQGIYVETCSGWFSDRSACYLASGKPILLQETGFSRHIGEGAGVLSFATADEAASAAERIAADYPRHARAARSLAESHLDSRVVLSRFVRETGVTP